MSDQKMPGERERLHRDGERRLRNLERRAGMLREIRRFFDDHGFVEIEAPLLVPSPGLELHLSGFGVVDPDGGHAGYLITSPEYQLKRLLCGGMSRIYSMTKVFRAKEAGEHHNPEFTLLEWYRAQQGWEAVASDVEELCAGLARSLCGGHRIRYQGKPIDLTPPWPRLTVAEAVMRHTGVRLRGDESAAELAGKISAAGHPLPREVHTWPFDDLFFSLFLDQVEPRLGQPGPADEGWARPVILHDWPVHLCALARSKPGAEEVVERFEAYAGGLELCNGFGELCDAAQQRRRFEKDLEERRRRGLPLYPIDERFLDALAQGMPPSGGVALGVDRLAMLLLDAPAIRDVLPFAIGEL